ncbi:hypothetical protein GmRootV118_59910 [Variovorax sp. V118]
MRQSEMPMSLHSSLVLASSCMAVSTVCGGGSTDGGRNNVAKYQRPTMLSTDKMLISTSGGSRGRDGDAALPVEAGDSWMAGRGRGVDMAWGGRCPGARSVPAGLVVGMQAHGTPQGQCQ